MTCTKQTSEYPDSTPVLMIDMKRNRIRIHKKTLHLLGDPEYIQFLVNPDRKILAVKTSHKQDHLAHPISWETHKGKKSFDFYSCYLIRSLKDLGLNMEEDHCYRFYGNIMQLEGLARFSLAMPIDIR